MGFSLKNFSKKIRVYLHITKASGIARRYFVMNGFDGAMTVFGIVLGSWIAGVTKPEVVLLAGFGACLAMGVSGFFGAFMAEKAERERRLKEMEEAAKNRVNPLHYEAARFVTVYVALIDGLSPVLTAAISLSPFVLAYTKLITFFNVYISSLVLSMVTLFLLGIYWQNSEGKRLALRRGYARHGRPNSNNNTHHSTVAECLNQKGLHVKVYLHSHLSNLNLEFVRERWFAVEWRSENCFSICFCRFTRRSIFYLVWFVAELGNIPRIHRGGDSRPRSRVCSSPRRLLNCPYD
ncbi:MAG: VIT1/CCC1 transporter family protein [Candidatus Bathyarchaeia archaeon]